MLAKSWFFLDLKMVVNWVFYNFRVDPSEVTFKVEKNSKGYSAIDVARRIGKSKLFK